MTLSFSELGLGVEVNSNARGTGRSEKGSNVFSTVEIAAISSGFAAAWGETGKTPQKLCAAARWLAQWRPNGETCGKPSVPEKPRKIFFDLA